MSTSTSRKRKKNKSPNPKGRPKGKRNTPLKDILKALKIYDRNPGSTTVIEIMAQLDVSYSTIYRWIREREWYEA